MKKAYKEYSIVLIKTLAFALLMFFFIATVNKCNEKQQIEQQRIEEKQENYALVIENKWEVAGTSFCRYNIKLTGFLSHRHHRQPVSTSVVVWQKCDQFSEGNELKLKLN